MNYKFINVLVFAAGAAVGSAVTWVTIKNRYARLAQEEIDDVIKTFSESSVEQDGSEETSSSDEDVEQVQEQPLPRTECVGQINWDELEDLPEEEEEKDEDEGSTYATLINDYTTEKGGAKGMGTKPYVISPYDFGEIDEYSQIELTYYADGTLEDDEGNIITDIDELIGPDALNTFGEYEDDAVFVRNEYLRTDFQILKDYRRYEDARRIGPSRVND